MTTPVFHTLDEAFRYCRDMDASLRERLAGELFKQATGLKAIEFIPYKGSGPAAADVVAGHVPYMWSVISIATPFVKQGRMKALAIASEKRAPGLPDVPTTLEGGLPDFAVSGWYILTAPAGTPRNIIDRVNDAAQKALKNEAVLRASRLLAPSRSAQGRKQPPPISAPRWRAGTGFSRRPGCSRTSGRARARRIRVLSQSPVLHLRPQDLNQ